MGSGRGRGGGTVAARHGSASSSGRPPDAEADVGADAGADVAVLNARITPTSPTATSPTAVASRSASSGLGSRSAAITRQTGQMQQSADPVENRGPCETGA